MNEALLQVIELKTMDSAHDLIDLYCKMNGYSIKAEELEIWINKIISIGDPLGIIIDNSIIAFLLLYCNNYQTREAYICNVYVSHDHRGKCLSKLLVEKAIQICRSRKFVRINLDVAQNNTPALKVYSQCGFAITEEYLKETEPFYKMSFSI